MPKDIVDEKSTRGSYDRTTVGLGLTGTSPSDELSNQNNLFEVTEYILPSIVKLSLNNDLDLLFEFHQVNKEMFEKQLNEISFQSDSFRTLYDDFMREKKLSPNIPKSYFQKFILFFNGYRHIDSESQIDEIFLPIFTVNFPSELCGVKYSSKYSSLTNIRKGFKVTMPGWGGGFGLGKSISCILTGATDILYEDFQGALNIDIEIEKYCHLEKGKEIDAIYLINIVNISPKILIFTETHEEFLKLPETTAKNKRMILGGAENEQSFSFSEGDCAEFSLSLTQIDSKFKALKVSIGAELNYRTETLSEMSFEFHSDNQDLYKLSSASDFALRMYIDPYSKEELLKDREKQIEEVKSLLRKKPDLNE